MPRKRVSKRLERDLILVSEVKNPTTSTPMVNNSRGSDIHRNNYEVYSPPGRRDDDILVREKDEVANDEMRRRKEPSLKEILAIIPVYSPPARIWAAKIKLLFQKDVIPHALIEAVVSRLPTHLFDRLSINTYTSPLILLDKIIQIDSPSQPEASRQLLTASQNQQLSTAPSHYFHDIVRLTRLSLPDCSHEQAMRIAWEKLKINLPLQLQHTLLLLDVNSPSEKTLEKLDEMWSHDPTAGGNNATKVCPIRQELPTRSEGAAAQSIPGGPSFTTAPTEDSQKLEARMDIICSQLERLEAAVRNQSKSTHNVTRGQQFHSNHTPSSRFQHNYKPSTNENIDNGGICWYHAKFGEQARRCTPPCQYNARGN
jgi:hypothetical protein